MTAFCCIPVTRPRRAVYAARSAEWLGWNILTLEDHDRRGPCWVRNELFQQAESQGATVIRFLDDDDLALNLTASEALAMTHETDVVYFDYLKTHPVTVRSQVRLSGDPSIDWMSWLSGNWVARLDALLLLGIRPWDETHSHCEASRMAFRMLRAGLKIKHLPVLGYYWHKRDGRHTDPEMLEARLAVQA